MKRLWTIFGDVQPLSARPYWPRLLRRVRQRHASIPSPEAAPLTACAGRLTPRRWSEADSGDPASPPGTLLTDLSKQLFRFVVRWCDGFDANEASKILLRPAALLLQRYDSAVSLAQERRAHRVPARATSGNWALIHDCSPAVRRFVV